MNAIVDYTGVLGGLTPTEIELILRSRLAQSSMTVQEFVPSVVAVCPAPSLPTYKTGFARFAELYGDRRICDISVLDLEIHQAQIRRNGPGAEENSLRALRFFFKMATRAKHRSDNPAMELRVPRRGESVRRELEDDELNQLRRATELTADPELNLVLFDFHLETGARRGGAIALRVRDLDVRRGAVHLREKNNKQREIPCSRELQWRILGLREARSNDNSRDGSAFLFATGSPLTRRRYDTWWAAVQARLTWAREWEVAAHWLRHTCLTSYSRVNYRYARAIGGHNSSDVTEIYTKPSLRDLIDAHDKIYPHLAIGVSLPAEELRSE